MDQRAVDPVPVVIGAGGLLMVPLIVWEGLEAVRGRTCCHGDG
ncbi:MAG TPA: hypothetical protein VL086_02135 [Candidatus Nitrosotalea sp.]|nr:hypothetical protein [Candidatus Nitrosotalea sp.]